MCYFRHLGQDILVYLKLLNLIWIYLNRKLLFLSVTGMLWRVAAIKSIRIPPRWLEGMSLEFCLSYVCRMQLFEIPHTFLRQLVSIYVLKAQSCTALNCIHSPSLNCASLSYLQTTMCGKELKPNWRKRDSHGYCSLFILLWSRYGIESLILMLHLIDPSSTRNA